MSDPRIDPDDAWLPELLRPLATDAAPVDNAALDRIRTASLAAYDSAGGTLPAPPSFGSGSPASQLPTSNSQRAATLTRSAFSLEPRLTPPAATLSADPPLVLSQSPVTARRSMKPAALAALLSSLFVAVGGVWFGGGPAIEAGPPLGDVLAKLSEAETLQLTVARDGQATNVLVRQPHLDAPGMIRWDDTPTRYRIARGSRLWEVDLAEASGGAQANPLPKSTVDLAAPDGPRAGHAATRPEPDSSAGSTHSYFDADGRADLLSLLDFSAQDRANLLRATPSGLEQFSGKRCLVYRKNVTNDGRSVRLEAYVDFQTRQLLALTARDPAAGRGRPPVAELNLIAMNVAVDEDQFKTPTQLADNDRIGKTTDSQGLVTLRPVGADRWTLLHGAMLVRPGDWVRCDARGANAVTVELVSGVRLIAGPNALLEVISPTTARLHRGELQVNRPEKAEAFKLQGPSPAGIDVGAGQTLYRVGRGDDLLVINESPVWLAGYLGQTAEDSIGSLIVEIDGRATPLSVGVHQVSVEIRDQIARTTIEETFVNHTGSRMEGTFHFPLPQDASISGFGMWIGNDLVEADIVEKQRAREIYETILREKRDPGLLEWTGGNIFKARVFPIEAHSEKRVKIVYTQVLPLRGNRFTYSYGLKSEMLAKNPLRELNLKVLVNSAVPLKSLESLSHACRSQLTKHSGTLEFTAQQYTPTKDFEVVCEVDHRENDVVVIPHQRGEDGYLLMQLMPPGPDGNFQREVLPDGKPLELIVLCDTSGSMDSAMRKAQREFVEALLASLGAKDRFALAACDVDAVWATDDWMPATAEQTTRVCEFLEQRVSLGWTDLERAFASVLKKATPSSQIIYVGDGVAATTLSDPAAFVQRLKLLAQSQPGQGGAGPAFHAVSVGSSYESLVLKGIASLGGGSMRQISGEATPQQSALELLNELAQPGLKDVQIEFRGIKVAAVYPTRLPNVPAGKQQIIVGRYLPQAPLRVERTQPAGAGPATPAATQQGEIIVTGTRDGQPVRFVARIELADAEQGNSFIPRLWARARLDELLTQGSSQMIQEEIIALSEEFHIITPYTSLLVLESDADRQRFGVRQRFEMRDGERFFAEGRDNAKYELQQQQMRNAGTWRLGLRRQILAKLARLGRDASVFQRQPQTEYLHDHLQMSPRLAGASRRFASYDSEGFSRSEITGFGSGLGLGDHPLSLTGWSYGGGGLGGATSSHPEPAGRPTLQLWDSAERELMELRKDVRDESSHFVEELAEVSGDLDSIEDVDELQALHFGNGVPADGPAEPFVFADFDDEAFDRAPALKEVAAKRNMRQPYTSRGGDKGETSFGVALRQKQLGQSFLGRRFNRTSDEKPRFRQDSLGWYDNQPSLAAQWIDRYAPPLPAPPAVPGPRPKPPQGWSDEAVALATALVREPALRALPAGGLRVDRVIDQDFQIGFDRLTPGGARTELWSQRRWLTREYGQGRQTVLNWADEQQRVALSAAFLLGHVRKSAATDLSGFPFALEDHSDVALFVAYRDYSTQVERPAENRAVLTLTSKYDPKQIIRLTIDTQRHVVLERIDQYNSETRSTALFTDHVEVAGSWWPQTITTRDARDRVQRIVRQTVTALDEPGFATAWSELTAPRSASRLIQHPLPSATAAKQAAAAGSATFEDRLVLLALHSVNQKWESVFEQLRELERLTTVDGAPQAGVQWLRIAVEQSAGRNEDARRRLVEIATRLPNGPAFAGVAPESDQFVATHIVNTLYSIMGWFEYGQMLEPLRPVFERQTDKQLALRNFHDLWLPVLTSTGRHKEAAALLKQMAAEFPGDVSLQEQYAGALVNDPGLDAAQTFLKEQIAKGAFWEQHELERLRSKLADLLESNFRYADVLAFTQEWMAVTQDESSVYARHLTALVMLDRIGDVEKTVRAWLAEVQQPGELPPVSVRRVRTATDFCLGSGHNLSRYYGMDPRWLPDLFTTVDHCIRREDRQEFVARIVDNGHFSNKDEGDRFRGRLLGLLTDELPTLPVNRLVSMIGWLRGGRLLVGEGDAMQIRQVMTDEWSHIAADVLARFDAIPVDAQDKLLRDKEQLATTLSSIYSSSFRDKLLPFRRRLVAEATADTRASRRLDLYNTLINEPWTAERETELFALLPNLSSATHNPDRLAEVLGLLHQFVDKMLSARVAADNQKLQDAGGTDKLTRKELAAKTKEFEKAAREAVADRLANLPEGWDAEFVAVWNKIEADAKAARAQAAQEAAEQAAAGAAAAVDKPAEAAAALPEGVASTPGELLRDWLEMERRWIDLQLDRDHAGVLARCWAILGEAPPAFNPDWNPTESELVAELFRTPLRQRAWVMVQNLAARKNADPELVQQVLAYIDAGIEQSRAAARKIAEQVRADRVAAGEEPTDATDKADEEAIGDLAASWKQTKYEFLLALDQADALVKLLEEWIATDRWNSPWRRSLAQLHAERGQLAVAVKLLEAIEPTDQLTAQDYKLLADWHQVLDQRAEYERCRVEIYKAMEEYQLANLINHKFNQLNDGSLQTVDDEALFAVRALFEKANYVSSYYWQLQNYYTRVRDFRLLAIVPESLVGHTCERTYNALDGFRSSLLSVMEKEATADEVLAHIVKMRTDIAAGKVPRGADLNARSQALDLRALDLLEALIARKASEVLNQPGQHAERALAALQQAFDREFQEGERLQYATFLANIGVATNERRKDQLATLAAEQLRQLQVLYEASPVGSSDRIRIGHARATLLISGFGRNDEGLAFLESILREHAAEHGGLVPYSEHDIVISYSFRMQQVGRHAQAEEYVLKQLDGLTDDSQRWTYIEHLNGLYQSALLAGSRTSLGENAALFNALYNRLVGQCSTQDQNRRYSAIMAISSLCDQVLANRAADIPVAQERLLTFAHKTLPELLKTQQSSYAALINQIGNTLKHRVSAIEAYDFYVSRMETYPPRYNFTWENAWHQHSSTVSWIRAEAASEGQVDQQRLAAIHARFLPLVLGELRQELLGDQPRGVTTISRRGYSYFWAEKEADFARVAEQVLADRHDSPRICWAVADYLYSGLGRHDRAIEIMFITHRRGLLDESGVLSLIRFLHEQNRYAESIALLEPLMDASPDSMEYRVLLIRAYHHASRAQQVTDLITTTDTHFHKDGRWTEGNIAALAEACLGAGHNAEAAAYYEEAINLRQRSSPNRGVDDGGLRSYYQNLSLAYSNQKMTIKAIDAASAAIVTWGSHLQGRRESLGYLNSVMSAAPDLKEYIAKLDADAQKNGTDSPILRKALGNVYKGKNEFAAALAQYRLALELQPNDPEVHQSVIECCDKLNDPAGAVQQLLRQIDFDRHTLPLYVDLAHRTREDATLAERAATSIVESAPNEAESHQALAQVRQEQNRWAEAIGHWERVAELRKLEPTGLLSLTAAQVHEQRWDAARNSLKLLRSKAWPAQFGDVDQQCRDLEGRLPRP